MGKGRVWMLAALLSAGLAQAEMRVQTVEWTLDGQPYSGHVVYDDQGGPRPGLVMVPNWMGVTDAAVERARELAGSDYVVLVADMYGKDVRPADAKAASAQVAALYADRDALRARAAKAVETLRGNAFGAPLDAERLGAVGFCFGGTTALELARAGSDLAGVVSLHGGLTTSHPATATPTAAVLVLNGAADRAVTAEDIAAFETEMDAVDADWQFVNFADAVHCFAEPSANSPPGCLYHERSAKRAYRYLHDFFAERFDRR
ncbi:MAG: dienelactone hydrolase family protein [Lysobacteraceae bacterium]